CCRFSVCGSFGHVERRNCCSSISISLGVFCSGINICYCCVWNYVSRATVVRDEPPKMGKSTEQNHNSPRCNVCRRLRNWILVCVRSSREFCPECFRRELNIDERYCSEAAS